MHFQVLDNHKQERSMSKQAQTKHCTICANAGMPEEVYSTHFIRETRDISSRVTCPLLKNNICSKCNKKGHFASSCKVVFREKKVQVVAKPTVKTSSAFDFGSESEEEPEPEEPEDFPSLPLPKQSDKDCSKRFTLECWQKENEHLLEKPASERVTEKFYWDLKFQLFCGINFKIVEKRVLIVGKEATIQVIEPNKRSWADDSDDE